MDLGLFEKACFELEGRCERMALHILGDPLKNKRLPSYLALALKYGHQVELVSSGYDLGAWDFGVLLSPPIKQINLSLSAYTDPKNPKRQDYLPTCIDFLRFHQQSRSRVFLNLRMHKSRLDLGIAREICEALGRDCVFEGERIKLGEYAFLRLSRDFEWVDIKSQKLEREKFCHGLSSQIGVLADGRVVPCCIDCEGLITLGDLKKQSLTHILLSPLALEMLRGFERGEAYHTHCQRCTYPARK